MVQNHLLQLVALTAMEPPIDFTADAVRDEKVKVLKAIRTRREPKHVVRGQYGPGFVEGKEVPGYREEEGVDRNSTTETYVAAKLFVDNWRWADMPFYVRTGKRLPRRETEIAIQFKRAPHPLFEDSATEELQPNLLLVHVQPDEGISLAIGAKVPGQGMRIRTVHMDFLLRRRLRRRAARRLRAPPARRDARRRRRSSRARTRSRSSGRSSTRSSRPGRVTGPPSRTTRPGRGARSPRTSSSSATVGVG